MLDEGCLGHWHWDNLLSVASLLWRSLNSDHGWLLLLILADGLFLGVALSLLWNEAAGSTEPVLDGSCAGSSDKEHISCLRNHFVIK